MPTQECPSSTDARLAAAPGGVGVGRHPLAELAAAVIAHLASSRNRGACLRCTACLDTPSWQAMSAHRQPAARRVVHL